MRRIKGVFAAAIFFFMPLILLCSRVYAQEKGEAPSGSPKTDIILVLDNSGSMIKNDPEFMTKKIVLDFLEELSAESRIAFVIFDSQAKLAMSLTFITDEVVKEEVVAVLEDVDYKGQHTNTSAAIERAIYELKRNGRKDAERVIILITDGIIDTGNRAKDIEKHRWLKNELAQESKDAGIRIFGVAVTEEADFELIQTLGHKTEGGYYRAVNVEDIPEILINIRQNISTPKVEPELPPQQPIEIVMPPPAPAPPREDISVISEEFSGKLQMITILLIAIGLIVLLTVVVFLVIWKKQQRKVILEPEDKVEPIPHVLLEDLEGVTGRLTYRITQKVTKIGRAQLEDVIDNPPSIDISIPKPTVSALHATIEYRDHNFYLVDQRSTNHTYLNGQKVIGEVRLKGGDEIVFDQYRFEFVLPSEGEKGGTVINPQPGEDVLSIPEIPDTPFYAEEEETWEERADYGIKPRTEEEGGWEEEGTWEERADYGVEPKEEEPSQETFPPGNSEEYEKIVVTPESCPNHPSYKATELCPDCQKMYCVNCMKEESGVKICSNCAGWF